MREWENEKNEGTREGMGEWGITGKKGMELE